MRPLRILLAAALFVPFVAVPAGAGEFESSYTRRIAHEDELHQGGVSAYADASSWDGQVYIEALASQESPRSMPGIRVEDTVIGMSEGESAAGVVKTLTEFDYGEIYGVRVTAEDLNWTMAGGIGSAGSLSLEASATLMRCDGRTCTQTQETYTAREQIRCSECGASMVMRVAVVTPATHMILTGGLVAAVEVTGTSNIELFAGGRIADISLEGWAPEFTGVWGLTLIRTGNCMPGPGVTSCRITAESRNVAAFSPAVLRSEMDGTTYRTTRSPHMKSRSENDGYFELPLLPGEYSLFAEDSDTSRQAGIHAHGAGFHYCNHFQSFGSDFKACVAEVEAGVSQRFDLIIDHALH